MTESYRVLRPGGRLITFSLHSPEEVAPIYSEQGLDWKVTSFHIRSDRWNETDNRKRSVAHTLIVCDKATAEGKYVHEHPLRIPNGTLAEDDFRRLKERADEVSGWIGMKTKSEAVSANHRFDECFLQVNLLHALKHAPEDFMLSALFHALHGDSATRVNKLKALRKLYDTVEVPDGDDDGDEPLFSEQQVLAQVDHSLIDYLKEAEEDLQDALRELPQGVTRRDAQ